MGKSSRIEEFSLPSSSDMKLLVEPFIEESCLPMKFYLPLYVFETGLELTDRINDWDFSSEMGFLNSRLLARIGFCVALALSNFIFFARDSF